MWNWYKRYWYKRLREWAFKEDKQTIDDKVEGADTYWFLNYNKKRGGEKTMAKEAVLKARVADVVRRKITFEFGATQVNMDMTGTGIAARKLKLKKGDKVSVTIKKLGK